MSSRYPTRNTRYEPIPYYPISYPTPRRRKPARTRKEHRMSYCPHCGKELPATLFGQEGHHRTRRPLQLTPAVGYTFIAVFIIILIASNIQP